MSANGHALAADGRSTTGRGADRVTVATGSVIRFRTLRWGIVGVAAVTGVVAEHHRFLTGLGAADVAVIAVLGLLTAAIGWWPGAPSASAWLAAIAVRLIAGSDGHITLWIIALAVLVHVVLQLVGVAAQVGRDADVEVAVIRAELATVARVQRWVVGLGLIVFVIQYVGAHLGGTAADLVRLGLLVVVIGLAAAMVRQRRRPGQH